MCSNEPKTELVSKRHTKIKRNPWTMICFSSYLVIRSWSRNACNAWHTEDLLHSTHIAPCFHKLFCTADIFLLQDIVPSVDHLKLVIELGELLLRARGEYGRLRFNDRRQYFRGSSAATGTATRIYLKLKGNSIKYEYVGKDRRALVTLFLLIIRLVCIMSWGKSRDATISWGLGGACNKHNNNKGIITHKQQ